MMISKNTTIIIVFVIILIAILVSAGWYYFVVQKEARESQDIPEETSLPPTQVTTTPETSETKIYRNEEWGFEFEYPAGWTFHEKTFYSPASKFNLVGASPEEKGHPNPIIPSLLVNIITPEFADNVIMKVKKLGATETNIIVAGIHGIKYEYKVGVQEEVLVDFSFKKYHLELSAIRGYEDVFNQILSSFKFLPKTETKTYRNKEWGFEFEYPEGWKIEENSVRTVSSKFNLILSPVQEPYQPHSPILLSIVTADFGDYTFQNLDKVVSEINIDGIIGERYDYKLGNLQRISILLSLNDLKIILGAGKGYENVLNQIIDSFKFIEVVGASHTKIYRNKKYGFEFRYPKEWHINREHKSLSYLFQFISRNI